MTETTAYIESTPDHRLSTIYKRVAYYLKPYWFKTLLVLIISMPIASLDAAIAYSLKPYLDGVLVKQSIQAVAYVPLIILGFTAVQGGLNYFYIYLNGWLGAHLVNDIRRDLYTKLQAMQVRYFDQTSSGQIIQRFFNDPALIQQNILTSAQDFLMRFVSSLALIAVLMSSSWKLALIAVVVLPCILLPSTAIRSRLKLMSQRLTQLGSKLISFYNETTLGIRIITSYNLADLRMQQFLKIQRQIYDQAIRYAQMEGWLTPSMHLIAAIGTAIILWQGSRMVAHGDITAGAFISFIAALIMLYTPIKKLGYNVMMTQNTLLAAARVFEVLDMVPEIQDPPDPVPMNTLTRHIRLKDVTFAYVPGHVVIKGINLTIHQGETVAIVGGSGGGKTTLVNLLCRFYDVAHGAITLDDIDIRDVSLTDLRKMISLVTQENTLFNGTIRDNILLGNIDATPGQVDAALEKAYLKPFIDSLPQGLDTRVGERGVLLSGGQRQRLAIARALVKDAPIVILDEATSALDNESEAIVQCAIESLMQDRTVIVIAHRLSTIRNAHRVLVINDGLIVEEGPHDELLAKGGLFTALYQAQFSSLTAPSSAMSN